MAQCVLSVLNIWCFDFEICTNKNRSMSPIIRSSIWAWKYPGKIFCDSFLFHLYFAALSSFACDLAPRLGCLFAAIAMHHTILNGVMRAPLLYFDTTPVGRILSRFSKDIDVIDVKLPQQISDLIYCMGEVI